MVLLKLNENEILLSAECGQEKKQGRLFANNPVPNTLIRKLLSHASA